MVRRILTPPRAAVILFTALLLALAFVFALPIAAAHASALEVVDPGEGGAVVFRLPTLLELFTVVNLVVWPILVGLVSNSQWSSLAKYLLHGGLTAAGGLTGELVESLTQGTSYDLMAGLISALISFGLAVLAWKTVAKAETKNGNSLASVLANSGNRG